MIYDKVTSKQSLRNILNETVFKYGLNKRGKHCILLNKSGNEGNNEIIKSKNSSF